MILCCLIQQMDNYRASILYIFIIYIFSSFSLSHDLSISPFINIPGFTFGFNNTKTLFLYLLYLVASVWIVIFVILRYLTFYLPAILHILL
jgi:hypothetical protein